VQLGIDILLILIALTNLALTTLSALGTCIRVIALQGVLLGLVAVTVERKELWLHTMVLAAVTAALKGLVFPRLLLRTIRAVNVAREVEPLIGYGLSTLAGTLALPAAIWLATRLPPPAGPAPASLLVPAAFHAILIGLFLIVTRRKAITQVIGYLALENGIFLFGVGLIRQGTLLVDLGVLLDLFVAVFVMGIAIFHISREFDHIDTDRLALLKG